MIGLELATLIVDGCILKDPCGGEAAGRSPCRSQKTGLETLTTGGSHGAPLDCVMAPANYNKSLLLAPTLVTLTRSGFNLPDQNTMHLNTSYNSRKTQDLPVSLIYDCVINVLRVFCRVRDSSNLTGHD